jgi:hypothetical protein
MTGTGNGHSGDAHTMFKSCVERSSSSQWLSCSWAFSVARIHQIYITWSCVAALVIVKCLKGMVPRGGLQQVRENKALQREGRKRKRPSRFV